MSHERVTMAVPWYEPEQWAKLLAMPEAGLEGLTHAEFASGYKRTVRVLEESGARVETVTVDVAAMIEWCARNGYSIDSPGRTAYVAALAASGVDADTFATMPVVDKTRVIQ